MLEDLRGLADTHGARPRGHDPQHRRQIASAADLVKGKLLGVPAAVVRGLGEFVGPTDDAGASVLVRSGPTDWFALGRAEAVRDALGVTPGSPLAYEVGVESVHPEEFAVRVGRAWAVAVLPEEDPDAVALDRGSDRWRVLCADPYLLGRAVARFEAALVGERLAAQVVARAADSIELAVSER